tara:strand:+ start:1448 stop:1816 length:369 start_codon:yes stop_codon:yes gene_type:complete
MSGQATFGVDIEGNKVSLSEADIAWIEVGRGAEAATLVPGSISPRQARDGLRAWGIGREQIAAFFATIEDPMEREAAEDAWDYALTIEKDDPLVAACAAFLDKTDAEVDQFFVDAAARGRSA